MSRQKKRKQVQKRKAKTPAPGQTRSSQIDRRVISAKVMPNADGAFPDGLKEGDSIVALHPIRLEDGRQMYFHAVQPTALNLEFADRFRREGARLRASIMGNLVTRGDGALQPQNPGKMIDAIEGLIVGVVFSMLAIEAFANHWISRLPDDAIADLPKGKKVNRGEMNDLSLEYKLKYAAPLNDEVDNAAGTSVWKPFVGLKRLRNDLVHLESVPMPERATNPDAYGQLVLGKGDDAVKVAVDLIERMNPGFVQDHTLELMRMSRPPKP